MSFFKSIKEFFTSTPAPVAQTESASYKVEAPVPEPVIPTLDPSGWPFQDVSPETATTSNEVVIKAAPKKKRPVKPKAKPAASTEPKAKPEAVAESKPAAIKAAPAKGGSKRVRKTKPAA